MFEGLLNATERRLWRSLSSPRKVQDFLDSTRYPDGHHARCPLRVLRERSAHCFDGGIFAAAALRRLGYRPRIIYMTAVHDDDHLIALYGGAGCWGAVAKSNFTTIRFREPVYRTLRELVMSYFEGYFNVRGERTLRGYTAPLSLQGFDRLNWMCNDKALDQIGDRLDEIRSYRVLAPGMDRKLTRVDSLCRRAGLLGTNPKGLYKPGKS